MELACTLAGELVAGVSELRPPLESTIPNLLLTYLAYVLTKAYGGGAVPAPAVP